MQIDSIDRNKIRPFYQSDLITVITGIRRSGKSVILKQIIEEIEKDSNKTANIIYINFEEFDYEDIKTPRDLHNYVKSKVLGEQKSYLFFDEIQNVENFEKAINSFRATMNVSIFITGSNARMLSGELSTLLSGRYVSFCVHPFCFREYCQVRELEDVIVQEKEFMEFAEWGGMPQRFQMKTLDETRVFLHDLYNSIVLKDIVQRSGAKNVDLLNKIIEYIVLNPSQTFSSSAISKYFEKDCRKLSTETLYNYLRYICDSYIVTKVSRYDIREYYQVAYLLADENVIEREFGAFKFDPDHFPKFVLSMDSVDFSRDGIIHKNIVRFLMEEWR